MAKQSNISRKVKVYGSILKQKRSQNKYIETGKADVMEQHSLILNQEL
jgi:hypothetical protein